MLDGILRFLKKHTTIRTKAILMVYIVIIFYRLCFSLFQFSLIRFLKGSIGEEYLIIGAMLAISNFLFIFLDIPLSIFQKYVRMRFVLLLAAFFLLISNLIFLFATLGVWLAFVAVFLYQLSMEIYFISITTYLLRLSSKEDYAQNIAQGDMADNTGDIIGLTLGGLLFMADRFVGAQNALAGGVLAFFVILTIVFIYEFLDRKHYTALEKHIFDLKYPKQLMQTAVSIGDQLVQPGKNAVPLANENEIHPPPFSWKELSEKFQTTFFRLYDLFRFKIPAPMLLISMAFLVLTYFWFELINYFEPVFVKEIFTQGYGFIIDNVPRYFFESAMFVVALIIPTFLLSLPIAKLADRWGKSKMMILGTFITGIALLCLAGVETGLLLFILFLVISCGFSIIYPSTVGIIGEEYKKIISRPVENSPIPGAVQSAENSTNDDEAESAGIISIIINLGQILGGLVGGLLFQFVPLPLIFVALGLLLIFSAIAGTIFFWRFVPRKAS